MPLRSASLEVDVGGVSPLRDVLASTPARGAARNAAGSGRLVMGGCGGRRCHRRRASAGAGSGGLRWSWNGDGDDDTPNISVRDGLTAVALLWWVVLAG